MEEKATTTKSNPLARFTPALLLALLVGILADKISTFDNPPPGMSDFRIGFFVIFPVVVVLLVAVFSLLRITKKAVIVSVTALAFLLAMIFGFWFYEFRVGYVSDMYGAFYIFSAPPAIAVGLGFGAYLARVINRAKS